MAPSFHSFMYVLLWLNNLFFFWTQGWSSQYLLNINISLCQNCPWKHICLWSAPGKYYRYFSALCLTYFIKDFFFVFVLKIKHWICSLQKLIKNSTTSRLMECRTEYDTRSVIILKEPGEIFSCPFHTLVPDFLWLQFLIELLQGLNELIHIKCLELCLALSKCSINVSSYSSLSRMLL